MDPYQNPYVIRITRDEAMSSHVDDLLNRQRGLRGDKGVARTRQQNLFYQNWFVLGMVGLLGAVCAWAIVEPYYDDSYYWQGAVTSVDTADASVTRLLARAGHKEPRVTLAGSVTVRDETIFVSSPLWLQTSGGRRLIDLSDIQVGETMGLYVDDSEGLFIAHEVVRSPPPQSAHDAALTLEHLRNRSRALGFLLFAIVGGVIGLFIGAADGFMCRLPRRALLSGTMGLLVGLAGGLISSVFANIVWGPVYDLASDRMRSEVGWNAALGFGVLVMGRSLAWGIAGMAMGLGQGIALRSARLFLYGLFGGVIGGLFGGLLFDPIALLLVGPGEHSAYLSRLVGLAVMGASVGGLIGVVELLARDAWLRMTQGPLAGKEFLLFKDVMKVGASPRSDIYLFNDPQVAQQHAVMRMVANECEVETEGRNRVEVNGQEVKRARLQHGDTVTIGRTMFVFQRRKG